MQFREKTENKKAQNKTSLHKSVTAVSVLINANL